MSDDSRESPYIAQYGVQPTREQFETACRRLEEHLAALKRIKLEGLGVEALKAEYVRYHEALRRFETFCEHEVSGFMRDWWRIEPISDVDRVRRRLNRQRNLSYGHFSEIKKALLAQGSAGIDAIKSMALMGDELLFWFLHDVGVEHFPDDIEPVLEAILALPEERAPFFSRMYQYREVLAMLRGYRARREQTLSPELAGGLEPGLAPALPTIAKSPAEFPELLFERFAAHIFTGKMTFHAAARAAWKEVAAEKSLDPVQDEKAELAEFDPQHRANLARPIQDYFRTLSRSDQLSEYQFRYLHADGRPVTFDELRQALYHVCLATHREPFRPAENWTKDI